MSDIKDQIKTDYLSGVMPKALAEKYDMSLNTVKSWIKRYDWSKLRNEGAPSKQKGAPSDIVQGATQKKKKGAPLGNRNSVGYGAPKENQNARKHGFYCKYLPEETMDIMQEMPTDPLDILWDQIQIAYAAIIRAQQIMYVTDKEDKTKSKIEKKRGKISGEKWEIQYAWDKQANFLQAQARAQKTLEGMITRYDDLLHKSWDLASEEQKSRIEQIKANTERLRKDSVQDDAEGVEIINDVQEKTGEDI